MVATSSSNRTQSAALAAALTVAALFAISPAHAAIFKVGTNFTCTHTTIAAALTAAENSAGPDTIRITRNGSWSQQALNFTTSQELTITGGYADCNTETEDATRTVIDGAGGAAASVFSITGNTGALIRMRKFDIQHGDVAGTGRGGGILFQGNGVLEVGETTISDNIAGFGGGIAVLGSGVNAELILRANTIVTANTARYNGGGLHLEDGEATIAEDEISIFGNQATGTGGSGGFGGGIHIRVCHYHTVAYVGSPGIVGLAVVALNSARYGGGVAVEGGGGCDNHFAQLRLFSTDAVQQSRIDSNSATIAGGGIYTSPVSGTPADVFIWNASVTNNNAPDASAIYLGASGTSSSRLYVNPVGPGFPSVPAGGLPCPSGGHCGRIADNISSASGRVISGASENLVVLHRLEMTGNFGSELMRLDTAWIYDSLLVQNQTTARLIETVDMEITGTTIAGNTIGGSHTLASTEEPRLSYLVIWQPGKPTLNFPGPFNIQELNVHDILSNETMTLIGPGLGTLWSADPRFVDPVDGDFSLKAASFAVDRSYDLVGDDYDFLGNPRELNINVGRVSSRDLGAMERQTLAPFLYNGNLDVDLKLWPAVTTGASSWDGSQNVSGPAGSGSVHVSFSTTQPAVSVRSQCIHLPKPGIYDLNGWGKSTGTAPFNFGDNVQLYWEFRADGSETCTGTPTRIGTLLLANNNTWRRPVTPTRLFVSGPEWTENSSIIVYLVVDDGGGIGGAPESLNGVSLDGWFDGITLDFLTDRIFANGFQ